jgi:curved DNA-binding protein CbpA
VSKNSSIDVIRKKYKKLALNAHPDRGGSELLFNLIKQSYKSICDNIKNPDKTFNELKDEHNSYKKSEYKYSNIKTDKLHTSSKPTKINIDDFNTKFNKVFEENRLGSPQDKGYSHLMNKSSNTRDDINIPKTLKRFDINSFNKKFNKLSTNDINTKQLSKYVEPEPLTMTKSLQFTELGVDKIKDFTGKNDNSSKLHYMDYKKAHSTSKLIDVKTSDKRLDQNFKTMYDIEKHRNDTNFEMTDDDRKQYEILQEKKERRERRRQEHLLTQDKIIQEHHDKTHQLLLNLK